MIFNYKLPSFNLSPVAPVFPVFSLPAKSTKLMAENLSTGFPLDYFFYLISINTMVWALELVAFILVAYNK